MSGLFTRSVGVWLVALVFLCSGALHAQAVKGSLVGNVSDSAALAVPGATVTITEVNTNISYNTTTNESGYYVFSNLKDGKYRVVTELTGFKKTVRDGIDVPVNATVRVDLKMEIGAIEESVTVVGESPLLQTDRADTSRTIESIQLTQAPLGFNRNFQGMLVTVPGALQASAAALRFLQRAGQPVEQRQRPVAARQQRPDRGHRRQPPDGAPDDADPVGRGDRDGEHQHQRLRRGVRARGRRDHQRHAEVRDEQSEGERLRVRQQREDERAGLFHAYGAAGRLPAERIHARRADPAQQGVLLRRLPAHSRQRRADDAFGHSAVGVSQRGLQRVSDENLRSGDRQRRRHGTDAVSEQHHPGRSHQPDREGDSRQHAGAEHRRGARTAELPG